jgi:hypothetical protein
MERRYEMSDRATIILGVCILLGCGAVAWSNWSIADAHNKQADAARQQADAARQQAKALADEENRFGIGRWRAEASRYQLIMNSKEQPAYLLDTATGEVSRRVDPLGWVTEIPGRKRN